MTSSTAHVCKIKPRLTIVTNGLTWVTLFTCLGPRPVGPRIKSHQSLGSCLDGKKWPMMPTYGLKHSASSTAEVAILYEQNRGTWYAMDNLNSRPTPRRCCQWPMPLRAEVPPGLCCPQVLCAIYAARLQRMVEVV